MQVDYDEGALTHVPGTDRYRKPQLFVANAALLAALLPPCGLEV
jgi:hypothetical protein